MNVTKEGIIERDRRVFEFAQANNIPIAMVLSGGYHSHSAEIVSESITQIVQQKEPELKTTNYTFEQHKTNLNHQAKLSFYTKLIIGGLFFTLLIFWKYGYLHTLHI